MAGSVAACAFNRLSHYASSPSNRAYVYAELAVSSPAVVVIIATIRFSPQKDGQAESAWVVDKIPRREPANGHPSQYYPGPT